MGEGIDKMSRSLLDLQPTAVLEFYRLYPDTLEKPNTFIPIHNGSASEKDVVWQDVLYMPLPIEAEGFEINGGGRLSRPKIRFANKDYLITNLLQNNKDFKNAKVVRKRTFLKFIDDINFDGGNPFGDEDFTAEISSEDFLISQKTAENKLFVEFELTSPLDLENFELNHRRILAKYCYWQYRGHGCNYMGMPVERENGLGFVKSDGLAVSPYNSDAANGFNSNANLEWTANKSYSIGQIAYLENPKIIINPLPDSNEQPMFMKNWYVCVSGSTNQHPESNLTYWQKDGCKKTIDACKKRFNTQKYDQYIIDSASRSEDYIGFQGNGAGTSLGKIYTTDQNILNKLNGNFTINGWFNIKVNKDLACILSTTQKLTTESTYTLAQMPIIYSNTNTRESEIRGWQWGDGIESFNLSTYYDGTNKRNNLALLYKVDGVGYYERKAVTLTNTYQNNSLNFISINAQKNLSSPHNYLRYSEDFRSGVMGTQWDNILCSISTDATGQKLVPYANSSNSYCGFNISESRFYNDFNFSKTWAEYGQGLTFSIHVKKPTTNSYRYFFVKHREFRNLQTNSFEIIQGSYTWDQANTDAIAKGGRLAVINTETKANSIPAHSFPVWFGATDKFIEGDWRWIDGSKLSDGYVSPNWGNGQPDNAGGNENYLTRLSQSNGYIWNDTPLNYNLTTDPNYSPKGYVLEKGSTTFDEYVIFDLDTKSIVAGQNFFVNSPEIKDIGNGWLRLKITINNANEIGRYFMGLNFGPLPNSTPTILPSKTEGTSFDITSNYGNGTSGIYISGAQLENGQYATTYNITTSSGYKHRDFNLDGKDKINVYLNNVNVHSWTSQNQNELLSFKPEEIGLGMSSHISDKKLYSISGFVASWALWDKVMSESDLNTLYKKAVDTYAPMNYVDLDGSFIGPNSNLIAWWDMQLDPLNSNKILNTHNTGLFNLTRSGITSTGATGYKEDVFITAAKKADVSNLHFGGFPGTDGFAYG